MSKKLETVQLQGIITAMSQIHHGGNEKTGASQLMRRQKFFVEGESQEIPIISGNAVRGYTRRLIMDDLLKQVDYKLRNTTLYNSMFSGGVLEGKGKTGYLDLDLRRTTRKYLHPISLYGMSYLNQTVESKINVDMLLPLCTELQEYVPKEYEKYCKKDIYTFIDHTFFTRKENAGLAGVDKGEDDPTVQMKVDLEVLIPGTKFYHGWVIEKATSLEISCLGRVIELWNSYPYIGGKSSSGYGKIKINYDKELDSSEYLSFVDDNKDKIIELLEDLDSA